MPISATQKGKNSWPSMLTGQYFYEAWEALALRERERLDQYHRLQKEIPTTYSKMEPSLHKPLSIALAMMIISSTLTQKCRKKLDTKGRLFTVTDCQCRYGELRSGCKKFGSKFVRKQSLILRLPRSSTRWPRLSR